MKRIIAGIALGLIGLSLQAQNYTWADNTACIFYTHCTSCHFPNGPGPFSLIDYADAYTARYTIRQAMLDYFMPPWPPNPDYQTYAHERLLGQTERDIIVAWVDQGAPEGIPANAPPPPSFSATGSQLPSIDFTGSIGTYVNSASQDDYMCFVIPTSFATDTYISDVEIIPGNRTMVHHVLIFTDTSSSVLSLDAAWPGPGYQNFGGTGSTTSRLIGGYVPGSVPMSFPSGMGMKIEPNSYIILQIHYPQGTTGMTDSTRINLRFAPGTPRELTLDAILSHNSNITPSPLAIPPHTIMNFTETYTIPSFTPGLDQVTVLSVAPHMHKVGTDIRVYAIKPPNDTIPLIDIPNWDYRWQGVYDFRQPMVFPEGTIIQAEATFDNTSGNPLAPNPNNWVYVGEATEDEMMLVYFTYLPYQTGDENIIVDTTTTIPTYNGCNFIGIEELPNINSEIKIYPNPANETVNISFEQLSESDLSISLVDMAGRVLFALNQPNVQAGYYNETIDVQAIPTGMYFIRIVNNNAIYTDPLIISR